MIVEVFVIGMSILGFLALFLMIREDAKEHYHEYVYYGKKLERRKCRSCGMLEGWSQFEETPTLSGPWVRTGGWVEIE